MSLSGDLIRGAAWLLLIAAALMPTITAMRIALLAAGIAWLLHALFVTASLVETVGAALLILVTGSMLARLVAAEYRVSFSPEEQDLLKAMFPRLRRTSARHLLDQGYWLSARAGDALTRAGEPLTHLYYLASGWARILSDGKAIAECPPGTFIGEMTVLTGEPATVSVELGAPSRLWCIPAGTLRRYLDEHPDVRSAFETAFRQALADKLVASNQRAAAAN
ncbi:Crp/Fnr family transcriptional regulator [Sphingomonas cavernae]|nr:cyclic nucleotide-binding domain-containing protein [Sphingomonas cavernae]